MTRHLYSDVDLSDLTFDAAASRVVLRFFTKTDGSEIESIVCTGVVLFGYHCPLDEDLPVYIGEVDHTTVPRRDAVGLFERLHYGYREPSGGVLIPDADYVQHLHVEGGVTVDILCIDVSVMA